MNRTPNIIQSENIITVADPGDKVSNEHKSNGEIFHDIPV